MQEEEEEEKEEEEEEEEEEEGKRRMRRKRRRWGLPLLTSSALVDPAAEGLRSLLGRLLRKALVVVVVVVVVVVEVVVMVEVEVVVVVYNPPDSVGGVLGPVGIAHLHTVHHLPGTSWQLHQQNTSTSTSQSVSTIT